MNKKLSHPLFIQFCKNKGIDILKITRNFVHINTNEDENVLSNNRPDLFNSPILKTMFYNDSYTCTQYTLKAAIKRNEKIRSIQIIRASCNLGLKDAKDLVYDNWINWITEVN